MPRRGNQQRLMKMLFMTMGVLIVMLIVVLIIKVTGGNGQQAAAEEAPKNARFVQGVSIAGVDVSGMTLEQAAANEEIFEKGQEAYHSFSYTFTVQGREFTYNATELGLDTSIDGALKEALKWGNTGADRAAQQQTARESGVDFPAIHADPEKVKEILLSYKPEYDVAPQNATLKVKDTFTPGDNVEFVPEIMGADVNIASLTAQICGNINKGDFSIVEAPSIPIKPKTTLDKLKDSTALIRSWSSSYKSHSEKDRVTNIKIIAGLLNGSVIAPMQTWSINDTAGPRTAQTAKELGWTEAPGIENGRYSEQYGGGVCQVSSTVYNCAIRSELEIIERKPHSWPSDYIEAGLDATISTGGPDVKLLNPFDTPVMLVCHVDETEKTVTVEFYGPPIKNGYSIEFKADLVQMVNPDPPIYHYDAATDPEGKPITAGKTLPWIAEKKGKTYKVYKYYVDAEGNRVGDFTLFTSTTYRPFQGVYYVNGPQYAMPTPDATS